jgi:hypothetical protein
VREALGKASVAVAIVMGVYLRLWWVLGVGAVFVAASVALALTDNRRRTWWDRLAKTVVLEGDPPPPVPEPAPIAPVEVDIAPS